jgi:hypothetical protein
MGKKTITRNTIVEKLESMLASIPLTSMPISAQVNINLLVPVVAISCVLQFLHLVTENNKYTIFKIPKIPTACS